MTLYNSESGDISMVLTGESLISRRMRVFKEERFTRMREIIQGGDVSFTNAEMLFHDYAHSPNPHQLGTYMRSDPANIKELQWLGINLVSCSNNHAYDFGEGGVLENIQQMDAAGLAHAGSGRNLAEARAPAYLDTDAGRVALISVTDSGPAESRAGEQRRDMLGRPGVSWLRSTAEFTVDRPTLRRAAPHERGAGIRGPEARPRFRRRFGFGVPPDGPADVQPQPHAEIRAW